MAVEADKKVALEEIKRLLEGGDEEGIKELLASLHPSDIARNLESLEDSEMVRVFRLLSPETASTVLLELDELHRQALISAISDIELVKVVAEMETDDAADIISGLPLEEAKKVLDGISWKESIVVQKLLKYPEDTAGGKMQAELVSVREDASVEETIEEVRKRSKEVDNISSVFVVDSEGRLTGTVSLEEISDREPIKVETGVDQEEVGKVFRRYDLVTMPVVDSENRLVGRITIDDVVDVIEEEIFEDFYRMSSLKAGERALHLDEVAMAAFKRGDRIHSGRRGKGIREHHRDDGAAGSPHAHSGRAWRQCGHPDHNGYSEGFCPWGTGAQERRKAAL
jgi:magnesium transporter